MLVDQSELTDCISPYDLVPRCRRDLAELLQRGVKLETEAIRYIDGLATSVSADPETEVAHGPLLSLDATTRYIVRRLADQQLA